jgi:hypothetical protein
MRDVIKILVSLSATGLILFSGILIVYRPPSKAGTQEISPKVTSYNVDWTVKKSAILQLTDYVSKNTRYEKIISIDSPNLKEITVNLSWIDDKTLFLNRLGLDTLELEVIKPDGSIQRKSEKSSRITKQGHIELTIPIQTIKPTSSIIKSENLRDAGKQLKEKFFNYTWVNEALTIIVTVQVGELRPLKRLSDSGNDFNLKVTSQYYHATLTANSGSSENSSTNSDSYKEISLIPPGGCPICDGTIYHEPWCPYYEDPFHDDPWDDDPWNDIEPVHVDKPWQIILGYIMFFLMVYFSKLVIFGGIL